MRFDPTISLGYPVLKQLTPGQDILEMDYPKKTFEPSLVTVMSKDRPDVLVVEYEIGLTVNDLKELIDSGLAQVRMEVNCERTFYRESFVLDPVEGSIEMTATHLRGTVEYMVMIVSTSSFQFSPQSAHEDYQGLKFSIKKNQVLALGAPLVRVVDKDQYKKVSAIFQLARDKSVKEGEFRVLTEQDYVVIQLHPNTYEQVSVGQSIPKRRLLVVNSLFVPVLIQLLHNLKDSPDARGDWKWEQIILEKLSDNDFDLKNSDSIPDYAQRLWGNPLLELAKQEFGI